MNENIIEDSDLGKEFPIEFSEKVKSLLFNLEITLIEKNRRYGNSALAPLQVFSKGNAEEGIRQRLDDKLARIKNSDELRENDVADLIGYLVLLSINRGFLFKNLID